MSILCYHAVDPDWASPLSVTPEEFAQHCEWLVRNRRVLPLEESLTRLGRNGRLPRNLAAITFDDGFASLFDHALPELIRHRLPATVFVVGKTLDEQHSAVDWVDDAPPWGLSTLTRDHVLAMREAGVTFGSHSYAHRDLPELSEGECESDLRTSREVLEDLLHGPVQLLTYPRGKHDDIVRRAARRAGYRYAFSLPEAREPVGPFSIPRVGVYRGNSLTELRIKASRWYLPFRTSPLFRLAYRLPKVAPPPPTA